MLVKIDLILEMVAYFVGIFAAMFGVFTYAKDCKRNARRETLTAYNELQRETFDRINKWLPSEIKEVCKNKKSEEFKELSGYLANIERFCVGINVGIYDFDTFYEISHGYFDNEKGILMPRILPILEVKLEVSDEDYFSNIHNVWKKMNNRSNKRK